MISPVKRLESHEIVRFGGLSLPVTSIKNYVSWSKNVPGMIVGTMGVCFIFDTNSRLCSINNLKNSLY